MTTNLTPVRVPVGSCVAVAPPGAGKTTVLRAMFAAAGLPVESVVCRDDVRAAVSTDCTNPMCRTIPSACIHFEKRVDTLVNASANTLLASGQHWLYDQCGCNEDRLRQEVDRAHAAGLAAVAFRYGDADGDITLEACLAGNAARPRRVPRPVVEAMYETYTQLTEQRLYELGFDLVVPWSRTHQPVLQLMPTGPDARHIDAPLAVVGDLHGCADTFWQRMLPAVGQDAQLSNPDVLLVGVGDIHDKGGVDDGVRSGSVELIRWWIAMIRSGRALLVDSNHSRALVRVLRDRSAPAGFGLERTVAAIDAQPDAAQLIADILATFDRLPSHLIFGDTVVVHAAMTEELLGRTDKRTRGFALYTRNSAKPWQWTGTQTLVHGHDNVEAVTRRRADPDPSRPGHVPGEVVNVDTSACQGYAMTAYLSSTGRTVSVPVLDTDVIDDALQVELQAQVEAMLAAA